MANSDIVKGSEIIEKDLFSDSIKSAEDFRGTLNELVKGFKELNTASVKFLKESKGVETFDDIKKTTDALKQSKETRKQLFDLRLQEKKIAIEEEKLKQQQLKTQNQVLQSEKKLNAEKEKEIKQREKALLQKAKEESAYNKESKRLTELRQKYKDLAVEGKANTIEANKLLIEITNLDKKLKDIDASVGQFNRSVGDYSNQVQDAIEKSGVFGGVLQKVTYFVELYESAVKLQTLSAEKNVVVTEAETVVHGQNVVSLEAETVATEQLTLAKRALNAVTSPMGLLILATVALVALAKAAYDVNQNMQDLKDIEESYAKDEFWGTGNRFVELTKATIAFRKEIKELEFQLLELKDIESDMTEISNDQTLSYNQREKAFQTANKARIDSATKALEIAKKEHDLSKQRIDAEENRRLLGVPVVGKGKALQDFYNAEVEARKKLFEAEDALADLTRTNAERERQIIQGKTAFEVDLILKKKENAFASSKILEEQIANETTSLKKRRELIGKLNKEELKNQEEQFEAFNRGIDEENKVNAKAGEELKKRVNFKELVNTKDAVQLARKIELLRESNLSDEQASQVAKIVAEAQNQRIENEKKLNQQFKLEIQLQQKLQDLELERAQLIKTSEIDLIADIQSEKIQIYKDANAEILLNENVFNEKMLQERLNSFEESKRILNLLYEEQQNKLKLDAVQQKTSIDNSNELDVIKNKKKEQIDLDYKIKSEKIERDRQNAIKDISKDEVENTKKIEERKRQIRIEKEQKFIDELSNVTDSVSNALEQLNNNRQDYLNKEIQRGEKNIDRQLDLAQRGLDNQLAFEEQMQAKRELQQKQEQERVQKQQRIFQLLNAYYNAYNAYLQQPNSNPDLAPEQAIKNVALADAVAKGVIQFAKDGNEDVQPINGTGGKIGVDDIPFMLTRNEAVITREANLKHKGVAKSLNDGTFDKLFIPKSELEDMKMLSVTNTAQNMYNSMLLQTQIETKNYLKELAERPTQHISVDAVNNIVESYISNNKRVNIIHKKQRRII